MRKNKRTTFTVTFLVVIAVLLGVIIGILPDKKADVAVPEEVVGEGDTASESLDYIDSLGTDESIAIDRPAETTPKVKPVEKKIFLVIDDVGNNLALLDNQLRIGVPVTFAIMPGRPFSEESARRIKEAGYDMILHQPMEAEGGQNPGAGAIMTDMDAAQIYKLLESNLTGFPEIKGINNHMGSKVTANMKTMGTIMSYLGEKGMFFLDSVTTGKSVAEEIAAEKGVAFAKRNVLFLDNVDDKASVKKAFLSGVDVSAATGKAIMIGHLKTLSLVEVIEEMYPELKKEGFSFHGISSLFAEGGAG